MMGFKKTGISMIEILGGDDQFEGVGIKSKIMLKKAHSFDIFSKANFVTIFQSLFSIHSNGIKLGEIKEIQ